MTLRARGWTVIGPAIGPLAEGSSDRPGRMSEPEEIVAMAGRMLRGADGPLAGKHVLVTAGPTRESLDPVRVVTNRSSGRMGFALAAAAFARGAEVTLITGPTTLEPPVGVEVVAVESTEDLRGAMAKHLHSADLIVMAAAPADFRAPEAAAGKIPRADGAMSLRLEPTVDVLESTKHLRREGCLVVGFALETSDGVEKARAKLSHKELDLIVLNMANEEGAGFEAETNRVTLVNSDSLAELPLLSKAEVAEQILDAVEALA